MSGAPEDYYGFGFLNYVFEGLVTGDRNGSAVGIVAFILVIGGAFGIIMKTGAIDAGIYAFIRRVGKAEVRRPAPPFRSYSRWEAWSSACRRSALPSPPSSCHSASPWAMTRSSASRSPSSPRRPATRPPG